MTESVSAGTAGDEVPWAATILREVCREAGLDSSGARLIKFTNNAVYQLASAPIIVRIPGSIVVSDRAPKVVGVARWLADHAMPAVRLVDALPQPLTFGGRRITFWHRVIPSPQAAAPNGRDLGRILRRLHALPPPPFELPRWTPLRPIRERIDEQDILSPSDRHFLEEKCDEIGDQLGEIEYVLPLGPIHGDSSVGNLIPSGRGAVICDFDSAAYGPREWDLTPVAVGKVRFGSHAGHQQQLADEYGMDILRWQHFSVLRQLRELQLVTSVLPVLKTNPALFEQWRYRFVSFRTGDTSVNWTLYR
ncbi:aminoglycoside phosphotransferase family protein [Nocardia terpenica]|uniref:phosphotransferase enzyme family protein n=1 Tax=Nocardia terpenica TaxID=455432 RepID=UPI002FE24E06